MYSNVHAAVSLSITSSIYLFTGSEQLALSVALPLGVISHYFVDYLFESNLGVLVFWYDIFPSIIYWILALLSGHYWLMMLSWWSGNLLDIIDKKFYSTILLPEYFKPTYYFHNHKKGIRFNLSQTKNASIISSIIISIIAIWLSLN